MNKIYFPLPTFTGAVGLLGMLGAVGADGLLGVEGTDGFEDGTGEVWAGLPTGRSIDAGL